MFSISSGLPSGLVITKPALDGSGVGVGACVGIRVAVGVGVAVGFGVGVGSALLSSSATGR